MVYKDKVKDAIINLEMQKNGFYKLGGTAVLVKNMRIKKTEIVADVVLITDTETGNQERYNDCIYPRQIVDICIKQYNL
jgi:hypothetical protein